MPSSLPQHPLDATLTVTKAARLLGVHANTIRAWSDQGRLRYYRINPRGDRRYRLGDLQRFLSAAAGGPPPEQRLRGIARPPIRLEFERGQNATTRDTARDTRHDAGDTRHDAGDTGHDPDPAQDHGVSHAVALALLADIALRAADAGDLESALTDAAAHIRATLDASLVGVWQRSGDRLVERGLDGRADAPLGSMPMGYGILGAALASGIAQRAAGGDAGPLPVANLGGAELAAPIPGGGETWGVLLVATDPGRAVGLADIGLVAACARALGGIVAVAARDRAAAQRLHRVEALRRVAGDIGSRLDLADVLADVVDHARTLFGADRAAVLLRRPDGRLEGVSHGLSAAYVAATREVAPGSLADEAIAARAPRVAVGFGRDPRAATFRAAVVQEGIDTAASIPLFHGPDLLGILEVFHDTRHDWTVDEIETLSALAGHAAAAIRTAQHYGRMTTWTAQLQSIQQLGARLSRLTSVREIGHAIATELRQLIEYHNVRVYRQVGRDLLPVAMLGQVGEYVDETIDQLRTEVGAGITGWVAEHRVAQNLPDAARDPRCRTIAGTEDDLDESMLLAPMLHEDQSLGVVVLSKLGLHQFTDDDLRLLVIYASFAAQAMANADATERLREQSATLERRLRAQRELLRTTESILTTLDTREVLERITERLGSLVACDNIAIEVVDQATGLLVPLTARGIHATEYLEPWAPGETGIATWVVEHNEPVLIEDERTDPRVNHFRGSEVDGGSLIVVPLLGPVGAVGVLTLERLGLEDRYGDDEFELVKLFAAQVSIALKNAEIHRAVEIRARTDDMTGLLNHGTFQDHLRRFAAGGDAFSLVMLDLDEFKQVNDRLGHQAGDTLLREIAAAISGAARTEVRRESREAGAQAEADLVFRYGGDEFALLLPGTNGVDALGVAQRVRAAIHSVGGAASVWRREGLDVSASIGLATYPEDGATATALLLAADRACFVAKRTGRGLVATAAEGLAAAGTFTLSEPTPVDRPSITLA